MNIKLQPGRGSIPVYVQAMDASSVNLSFVGSTVAGYIDRPVDGCLDANYSNRALGEPVQPMSHPTDFRRLQK